MGDGQTQGGERLQLTDSVQTGLNMYDLHRLGWNSFQQLCMTITREVLE